MSEYIETLTTDANGAASTTLEEGEYELIGNASGFDPTTINVTLDANKSASISISESSPTPADFSFEQYLSNGQYTAVIDHPDYWADIQTVGINDAPYRHDVTLSAYGDAIDTTGLEAVARLTTDVDGLGRFDNISDGGYILEFEHPNYQTKTQSINHLTTTRHSTRLEAVDVLNPPKEGTGGSGRTPPVAGDAEGFDPGIILPAGDPFFECAVIDTDAGADFSIPVLVTNAGGSKGATDIRLELDRTGEVVYTRDVTLRSGNYTYAKIPVRSLAQRVSLPADVTVSTIDDFETFTLTATADARAITGPGIPTTLGGQHTLGNENPSTLGPDRAPFERADRGFPAEGWGLTLEQPNGERRVLTSLTESPDIEDVHTKLSSWSATVPADRSLNEWDYDTRAYLTRDGEIVNIGWCDTVESSTDGQETELSGPGPFGELTGDEMEVTIRNNEDWRAAEHIVRKVAPEWDISVLRTDDPLMVVDESYSGSPLSILKSFCEDYGLFFRPSMTHFRQGMIFEPGGVASLVDLDPSSVEVNSTSEGYANEIVFSGAGDIQVTVSDEAEIRRLAERRDLRIGDARETVSIDDGDVTSERQAKQRARASLRKRIGNYEAGGSIEMPARRIRPGLAYPMPSDAEVRHSARSVYFDGDGSIEFPSRMMKRLDYEGAVAIAIKVGDWSDLTDLEMRLWGAWGPNAALQTTTKQLQLQTNTDAGRSMSVRAFDSPPNEGDWHVVHYEWEYDEDARDTVIQAGHDGEIVSTDVAVGAIRTETMNSVAIGRVGPDYLDETIVESAWFFSEPDTYAEREPTVSDTTAYGEGAFGEGVYGGGGSGGGAVIDDGIPRDRYVRLNDGTSVSAVDMVARYPLNETPDETTAFDTVGGWHGTKRDTRPAGRPVTLDSASHTLTTTTGDFNRETTYDEFLRAVANK